MKIAIDIDGTITEHPELFCMIHGMFAAARRVIILTARPEKDREVTLEHLALFGIHEPELHMYPDEYPWPYPCHLTKTYWSTQHAQWKAAKCLELGVNLLFDDCPQIIAVCRAAGIRVCHVLGA